MLGTKRPKRGLTEKQAKAVEVVRERAAAGEPVTPEMIADAHDLAYDLKGDRKMATTYAGQNMRRSQFLAALQIDSHEVQVDVKTQLLDCLHGTHPLWPKDKELYLASLKLLARGTVAEKHEVKWTEAEFADKSLAELDYYSINGEYPTPAQLAHYKTHQVWPSAELASGRPQ